MRPDKPGFAQVLVEVLLVDVEVLLVEVMCILTITEIGNL